MQDLLQDVQKKRTYDLGTQVMEEIQSLRLSNRKNDDSGLMQAISQVILEFDVALIENDNYLSEVCRLKDEQHLLEKAFEKEREIKRKSDCRLHELELQYEDEKEKLQQKIITLERSMRDISTKIKMTEDQSIIIEQTEQEIENKYRELKDKYSQLLQSNETRFVEELKSDFETEKSRLMDDITHMKCQIEEQEYQMSLTKRSLQEKVQIINNLVREKNCLADQTHQLQQRIDFLEKKIAYSSASARETDVPSRQGDSCSSTPVKGSCLQITLAIILILIWSGWDGLLSRDTAYCPPI